MRTGVVRINHHILTSSCNIDSAYNPDLTALRKHF
jgi:hypothetical protein